MDSAIAIKKDVYWVGANDRETHLFEGLWPLPRGVSYNAYLIDDKKTALIDTVKNNSFESYLNKIRCVTGEDKKIDYLIINHMEPDHSGSIKMLLEVHPEMQIVCNKKTVDFLKHFYGITENLKIVEDGDVLDLGKRKLKFFLTPMVHWPETMMTYLTDEKVLFSGDAFGGFGALDGGIFDDEVDIDFFEDEILRYFSNIVGKYCPMVQKAIAKLKGLEVRMIASTHGPIWRTNPTSIVERYDRWSKHEAEEGVVITYASMYGNTEKMMEALARGLAEEEICKIRIHNVSTTHISYLIRDAWRYKALILGSPTYDTKLYPLMDNFIRMLEHKGLTNRLLGLFGTYGWSGGGVSTLTEFAKKGKWELIEPIIEAHCSPTMDDLQNCYHLGQKVVKRLKG
ncbi:MAG: FprA family A-type flavoprotein [Pseudomonadota bacterium]